MSAPPFFRLVDERRVAVVRDEAAVARVFAEDPVASCMVAARVADHGIDPAAIGGELWTRRRPEESLCFSGPNLIPLRGKASDISAFADKAMGSPRRCSSLVGPVDLVLPMWQRLGLPNAPVGVSEKHYGIPGAAAGPRLGEHCNLRLLNRLRHLKPGRFSLSTPVSLLSTRSCCGRIAD